MAYFELLAKNNFYEIYSFITTIFFNQITGITESDSGRYVCTASDGVQVINQYVDLEVQGI